MGRYAHGTAGFVYKYVYARQPQNLSQLGAWCGLARGHSPLTILTQFFAPYRDSEHAPGSFVDRVGPLTAVYRRSIPEIELPADVESAIYAVGDDWLGVVRTIDRALPGPALAPDLSGGQSFAFERRDWPALAARIGHGADPDRPETLTAARDAHFASGDDEFLPYMAACALAHAVTHELERFVMTDDDPRETNLWEVALDYACDAAGASEFETRDAYARLLGFAGQWSAAMPRLDALLTERPGALHTARAAFGRHIWQDDWGAVHALADRLLGHPQDDATRAELLLWRGEAAACAGESQQARGDAEAAATLGRSELLEALDASGDP